MKKFILIIFVFSFLNTFSQSVFFEKSFEPLFNSGLNSIVHDSIGNFYTVGFVGEIFNMSGIFIKLDKEGNFIYQNFNYGEGANYSEIIIASDGNLLACGYSIGCDVGESFGRIVKFTTSGDTIWTKRINEQPIFSSVDIVLRKIISLNNNNILLAADSTLYFCNNVGDSLFSSVANSYILSITEGINQTILCGNQSGLLVLDSAGQQLIQVPFAAPVSYVNLLSDSSYLINSGNTLLKLDSAYNIISQFDLSQLNFVADNIVIESDLIWICNSNGSDFASFNFNLQLIDSFRTQGSSVNVSSFSIHDSIIIVAGTEHSIGNYSYLKSYSTLGNYMYYPSDLALVDVSFDTVFVDQPSPLPSGVYRLNFAPRIIVQNTGSDTIHSFYINAESLLWGVCGNYKNYRLINNINIIPGQTMSIPIDTLSEFGIAISHFPFTYKFCPWISCPNFKVDKDHSNDFLCDSFSITGTDLIAELNDYSRINIFPNPFDSQISILYSGISNQEAIYKFYDLLGKEKLNGELNQNENIIDLSSIPPGVYFIIIFMDDKVIKKKIVKI